RLFCDPAAREPDRGLGVAAERAARVARGAGAPVRGGLAEVPEGRPSPAALERLPRGAADGRILVEPPRPAARARAPCAQGARRTLVVVAPEPLSATSSGQPSLPA